MKGKIVLLLSLILSFQSCFVEPEEKDLEPGATRLFISNEGNFQWGNGSLSIYDTLQGKITSNSAFQDANGIPLGDVFQSMFLEGSSLYMVINNSGKIHVANKSSLRHSRTYTGFISPRYMTTYGNDKALVSDIYADKLSILNLASGNIDKQIPLPGWTERLYRDQKNIYVCNLENEQLYVFDTDSEKLSDSIPVGYAAVRVVQDKNQRLWVLSKGDKDKQIDAQISLLNQNKTEVEKSWKLGNLNEVRDFVYDSKSDKFYILANDVYSFDHDNALNNSTLITANGKNYYAIHFLGSSIYLADAKDYVQAGTIEVYQRDGEFIKSFNVGPIPNGFIFDK